MNEKRPDDRQPQTLKSLLLREGLTKNNYGKALMAELRAKLGAL
ncbi:hypothetical protein WNZ14_07170 [Hoeflea sp. AS60]